MRYELALAAYCKTAALSDKTVNPVGWANEQSWVAYTIHGLARYVAAEPMLRDILAVCEQYDGPNDPETAIALNNLAILLKATDRLGEAEP